MSIPGMIKPKQRYAAKAADVRTGTPYSRSTTAAKTATAPAGTQPDASAAARTDGRSRPTKGQ
jgi:hypothetical protein